MKKACLYIHRYCGWVVGVVFFILCLTGCLLVIQPEIEYWAEPSRFTVTERPGETMKTPGRFVETFEKLEAESFEDPTTVHVLRLRTSSNPGKTWYALVSAQNEKRSWTYIAYVDPYTAEGVSYGPARTHGFFRAVHGWHASLKIKSLGFLNKPVLRLAGDTSDRGRPGVRLVGLFGLLAAIVLIAGLIRWWPKWRENKNLRNSFRPVLNGGVFRAIFDLHSVGGFYATLLLLALCLSGSWRAVPWFRSCCDKLVGYEASAVGTPGGPGAPASAQRGRGGEGGGMRAESGEEDTTNYGSGIKARRSPNAGGISPHALAALTKDSAFKCDNILDTTASLDDIFERQQELTPSSKGYDVVIPTPGSNRAITITRYGDFAGFCKPDVYYWDQYTGDQLGKTSFGDLPFSEQFCSLVVPFHTGAIFGSLSRYILFAAGFVGVILSVTGYTIMAFRYRRKSAVRRKGLVAESGETDKVVDDSGKPDKKDAETSPKET